MPYVSQARKMTRPLAQWRQVDCPRCKVYAGNDCIVHRTTKIMGFDFHKVASHPHVARIRAGQAARKNKRGGAHNHNGSRKRR